MGAGGDWPVFLFIVITNFGSQYFYMTVIPGVFWYDRRRGRDLMFIFISTAFINFSLKEIFRMPRPPAENWKVPAEENPSLVESYGFPSGHSQLAAAFWGYVGTLASERKKLPLLAASISVPLLIGYSRVALGVHYAGDVIGGLIIGTVTGVFIYYFSDPIADAFSGRSLWDRVLYALLIPLAMFMVGLLLLGKFIYVPIYDLAKVCGLATGFTLGLIFYGTSEGNIRPDGRKWVLRMVAGMSIALALYFLPLFISFAIMDERATMAIEYIRTGLFGLAVSFIGPKVFNRWDI